MNFMTRKVFPDFSSIKTDQKNQKFLSLTPFRTIFLFASILAGFGIRAFFIFRGHLALDSDEVGYYQYLHFWGSQGDPKDYLGWIWKRTALYHWLFDIFYFLAGRRPSSAGLIACFFNVVLYLLWTSVLFRRTGKLVATVPLLFFLIFPAPCVSCLGTQICEVRFSYLYGAILVLFAGSWFESRWKGAAFLLVSVWGCYEDLFTFFFVFPVLCYEETRRSGVGLGLRFKRWAIGILTFLGVSLVVLHSSRWWDSYKSGYLQPTVSSPSQWLPHFKLVAQAWPLYWIGGLPWGYLQNSHLGQHLMPPAAPWIQSAAPVLFWVLLFATLAGSFTFFRGPKRLVETWLWFAPSFLFILFFIFGSQAWDSLSFRYLGFLQIFPALLLGLWASVKPGEWKTWYFILALSVWVLFNAVSLGWVFNRTPTEHPGNVIADRLEQMGLKSGFCNYWVQGPVWYFSQDHQIFLTAYDHPPISRGAAWAAQNDEKIALVWLQGLDHPDLWNEVVRQIQSLNYHPLFKQDYQDEGWFIMVWEKNKK